MKKRVKAWVILVDGWPNVPNGIFDTKEDAEKQYWRGLNDPIVPCIITYEVPPITKNPL